MAEEQPLGLIIITDDQVETVAKAIYRSLYGEAWPPRYDALDAENFRRTARNVLMSLNGVEPDYRSEGF
jgi:hypothetical protein